MEPRVTPPIASGNYVFTHKFAEQPDIPSIELIAHIRGDHIELVNESESDVFPRGILEEGTLIWHKKSAQWIIGQVPADADAGEVGGCSDGPAVIDLEKKIYWTC